MRFLKLMWHELMYRLLREKNRGHKMLPLEKIKWKEETLDEGIVELRGELSLQMVQRIAPEYHSEIDNVKREIRLRIWREVYGELTQPVMELQLYARRGAAYGADSEIRKLCETINRLLEPPLDSSTINSQASTATVSRRTSND